MPASGFDHGIANVKTAKGSPWVAVWTPGVNLANLFNLYDSRGDVTIGAATSIPTTLDGPIQVVRYGTLTVNAALTASQRCRGLIILSDARSTGAAGSISMTARGAAGTKNWAVDRDIFVPQSITFTGRNTSYADFLKWIRQTGYCIFDPTLYACPPPGMGDVTCDWATWTPYGSTIISVAGCGAGAAPGSNTYANFTPGGAGSNAPGGGGGGCGEGGASGGWGGPGRPWGGGPGGGGGLARSADAYGGFGGLGDWGGGGAGNPPGPGAGIGTGGVLLEFCRGNASFTAGHSITANGSNGGSGTCGGGGSAGGVAGFFFGGSLTGTPNLSAAGGPAGGGANIDGRYKSGSAGGVGSTQSKSFATMGWAA
jgi:hypothetical protein